MILCKNCIYNTNNKTCDKTGLTFNWLVNLDILIFGCLLWRKR